jgi:predicted PurR-regulated permease PerM
MAPDPAPDTDLNVSASPGSRRPAVPPARTLARWLFVAVAVVLVGSLFWRARSGLTPFVVGLVLAYLLLPIVNLLSRRIPRAVAILIVYIAGIALIVGVFAYLVPVVVSQVQQLLASFPTIDQMQQMGTNLLQQYQSRVPPSIRQPIEQALGGAIQTVESNFTTYVQRAGKFVWDQIVQVINAVSFVIGFFIVPIWLFYVLKDQARGRAFINGMLHPRLRNDFWNVWEIVNHDLGGYVRGQLTLSLIIGVLVGLGMFVLHLVGFYMPYAVLLGIVSATTELIPAIGPALGMIPGVLIGLFISPTTALAVLTVYLVVQQIENTLLVPRIIGGSIGIHPAILTVLIIAMGYAYGVVGVILAAPLAAIARDLFLYVHRRLNDHSAEDARQDLLPAPKAGQQKKK